MKHTPEELINKIDRFFTRLFLVVVIVGSIVYISFRAVGELIQFFDSADSPTAVSALPEDAEAVSKVPTTSEDAEAISDAPSTSPENTTINSNNKCDEETASSESNDFWGPGYAYTSRYNQPPSYYEEQALADLAIERYLNGDWDGYPSELDGHIMSISEEGSILMDGGFTSPSTMHCQHCIDFPKEMINQHTYMSIGGEGTYIIENNRLVNYFRCERTELFGGALDWDGMDTENYRPFDVYFYYDAPNDTLFVVASSVPYNFKSVSLKYNVGIYLYMVPDRTMSKLQFVSEIANIMLSDDGLLYLDVTGNVWGHTVKNGKSVFEEMSDPKLKNKFPEQGIAAGEIVSDWHFTFADGYINARDAFPEGSFNHPVVTTPRVYLDDYTFDCRYKDLYSNY